MDRPERGARELQASLRAVGVARQPHHPLAQVVAGRRDLPGSLEEGQGLLRLAARLGDEAESHIGPDALRVALQCRGEGSLGGGLVPLLEVRLTEQSMCGYAVGVGVEHLAARLNGTPVVAGADRVLCLLDCLSQQKRGHIVLDSVGPMVVLRSPS